MGLSFRAIFFALPETSPATFATMLSGLVVGSVLGDFDPIPGLPGHAWLLLGSRTRREGPGHEPQRLSTSPAGTSRRARLPWWLR